MCKKESLVVSAAIVLAVAMVMFFPVMGSAGSLEPSAAPAPTMKTLDQVPPTWSQKISGAARFELVLDGVAVLDKETGLVWEQSPDVTTFLWSDAIYMCLRKSVGNRKGWRLPSVEELESLVDPTIASPGPTLPSGHQFSNVQQYRYWSATTSIVDTTVANIVNFSNGIPGGVSKDGFYYMWCVRGGKGNDAY